MGAVDSAHHQCLLCAFLVMQEWWLSAFAAGIVLSLEKMLRMWILKMNSQLFFLAVGDAMSVFMRIHVMKRYDLSCTHSTKHFYPRFESTYLTASAHSVHHCQHNRARQAGCRTGATPFPTRLDKLWLTPIALHTCSSCDLLTIREN